MLALYENDKSLSVIAYRGKMVRNLIKIELTESIMQGFRFAGGYVVALPILGYHYLMGRELNYQESLTTLSMLGFASLLIFNQMYAALSMLSKFYAILKRIGEILEMDEFDSDDHKVIDENECNDFNYDTKDFNFDPEDPQLVVIAGMIGSGKSTLLS